MRPISRLLWEERAGPCQESETIRLAVRMLFQSAEKSDTICFLVSWSSGGYFRREGKPFRTRLPYSGLLLLVLAAPFERLEAVFTVSRQQVTNLELVILISLLAWSGSCTLSQRPRVVRTRLALPIFCLLAWMFLSSLFASAHRANSLQFTARCLVGVLIFSMARWVCNGGVNATGLSLGASLDFPRPF